MTHRERLSRALEHLEPDRVPMDLGGTASTGIVVRAYERLKAFLGVSSPTVLLEKPFQLAQVSVDDGLLDWLGVDTRGVFPRPARGWQDIVYPDGSYEDEWGIVRAMPADGLYYDVVRSPFANGIGPSDLDRLNWPNGRDPSRVEGVREEISAYHDKGYAVVVNVRAGFITQSQLMRGFEGWFTDMVLDPSPICDLMDRILEYQVDLAHSMLDEVGDKVDVVAYADDIGTQNGLMVSPDMYRKYLKPRQARLFEAIRARTPAKIFYHTCGGVYPLIGDLIEIGVDVLNPIQVSAKGMEPGRLKDEFGDRLSFWGGIDTHKTLPYGTPDDVRAEVKQRLTQMAKGGGYVVNSVHNIQADVPPENILTMFEAAVEYGDYGRPVWV